MLRPLFVFAIHCHVKLSHFPALLTFAQRARCAAPILLRSAALIVLRGILARV